MKRISLSKLVFPVNTELRDNSITFNITHCFE
jgi:hypothetical protein